MQSRSGKGFTLVELLVVVVVIGILATIVHTRFATSKSKAFTASMKSDLHNLQSAEEAYFYDHRFYTSNVAALGIERSPGVELTIVSADTTGWSATARHPAANPPTCSIFAGTAAPLGGAVTENVIGCQ